MIPQAPIFILLRAAFSRGPAEASIFRGWSGEQWNALFETAARQGVLAIVYDALTQLGINELNIPKNLHIRWALSVQSIENRYARQVETLRSLAQFYNRHDIEVMVLKGIGLSTYYPVPRHRECGDVDIYLYGDYRRADSLVETELGIPVKREKHHHTIFRYNDILIENHFDFINVHHRRSNADMEAILKEFAAEPGKQLPLAGAKVNLPPANLNALFLARHSSAHFASASIELRHVADWMWFVEHNRESIDFERIGKIYETFNLTRFMNGLSGIAIDYLGMRPDAVPPFERNVRLEEKILAEILNPRFGAHTPQGVVGKRLYQLRKFWVNRWKTRITYSDSLASSFLHTTLTHIIKPKHN